MAKTTGFVCGLGFGIRSQTQSIVAEVATQKGNMDPTPLDPIKTPVA